MKKFFHTFLVNISLFFVIILAIEGIIWHQENQTIRKFGNLTADQQNMPFHPGINDYWIKNPKLKGFREPEGLQYNKQPIAIFGCSYAYGFKLQNEQTLSYKLSHLGKVPVYNRAITSWGIQHMLYQTKREDLYKTTPEPQYAIFVYFPDHINRLYYHSFILEQTLIEQYYLRYEEKNGKLQEVKHDNVFLNQIQRLYLYNKINQYLIINAQKTQKHYDFALKHFIEAKEEMQKHWKNTKYAVLFYVSDPNENYLKSKLKENNFIVMDADEMTGKNLRKEEYMSSDYHPKEEAWDLIVPKLIEKLGI